MTKNNLESEEQLKSDKEVEQVPEEKTELPKKSPVKLITIIVLSVCLLYFIWYVLSERHTPYTTQARLNALVIPIVPNVSGYLVEANVRLHSNVHKGDTIFKIDQRQYKFAVESTEAKVDRATQKMGLRGASVKSAVGRLGMARAQLDRAQRNYNRVIKVFNESPGALSMADMDASETSLAAAQEQVMSAEADLEKEKQNLGVYGPENADLRAAIADLEQAQLNLAFTILLAPSDGFIESFNLDVGFYCSPGNPIATFISTRDIWIQAEFKENNLENIQIGEPADIVLDITPGRKFPGIVRSIGYAVSSTQDVNRGGLPNVEGRTGWLRDPQRFPVIISVEDYTAMKYLKIGGQVDVVVYSESYHWLNAIARFRLWINSKLSYVR
jgi:multidrug resistance efflux pump